MQRSLSEADAAVRGLQKQVAELMEGQTALRAEMLAVKQKASETGAGFPALLPKDTLVESMREAAAANSKEIEAALATKGMEVTGYGKPKVIMPEALAMPYVAEVDLSVSKAGGRTMTIPLTFRADWSGKWQVPPTEELLQTVAASLAPGGAPRPAAPNGQGQPQGRPTAGLGGSGVTAPPTPAPTPPRDFGPKIQGIEVKEVDLRGKDIFGGGR